MKIVKINIFILLINVLFSCNEFTKNKTTIIGEYPNNCSSPSDAIIKFNTINEKKVANAILEYAKKMNVEFSNSEERKIKNWIFNDVFSNKRNSTLIKEWNINDEDICKNFKNTIIPVDSTKRTETVDINICNTFFTQDLSAANYWNYDSKNFSIDIQYCFYSSKYIKQVGYYEIIQRNGKIERIIFPKRKFQTVVYIYTTIFDKEQNKVFKKQIISDNGFLYTAFSGDL